MAAIAAYLDLHDLSSATNIIAARANGNVRILKPSPALVVEAITSLEATPTSCTLVGDSPTDIAAAKAANVRSVGYANGPGKTETLSALRPAAVTTTMTLLNDICAGLD